MCGLAGILFFDNNKPDLSVIKKMTDCMGHRGPDAVGFYVDDTIALGHRRLSIIDLSEAANQPFADYTGRFYLIFNGEIYNYREVKAMLPEYPYKTTSDTELLIAAYSKWGSECLQYLKGMFVFIVWDKAEKELFIARDRLGVKPLYYYVNDRYFLFASEIRGILSTGFVPKKINTAAIKEFLSYQSIGFPISIIENIYQLEAGAFCKVKNGKVEFKKYWNITDNKVSFDFQNKKLVYRQIRTLLRDSVQRRLISDVPIGAFLSGGIDSSTVVGLMAEVSDTPPNTFTVGFMEKDFDESEYAKVIARKFNTRHNQVLLKPSVFIEELTNALNSMDSPSGDGINTYVVSKAIKKSGLIVALSGVGGDELFAGYPFFKQYLVLKNYENVWRTAKFLRKAAAGLLSVKPSNKANRLRKLLAAPRCSIAYFYPEFRRIISPELLSNLTLNYNGSATVLEKQMLQNKSIVASFPALSQVSISEYLGYTQHTLLKDTDQMSMAVSLEVREPFFDHELVEFILAVPDELKYPVYPKSLLVESLNGLLPYETVHRKKQGFLFPWNVWMKNELRSFCEKHIHRMAQRDFINGENLLKYWKRFLNNDTSVRWMEVWLFVILEYWLEKNEIQ